MRGYWIFYNYSAKEHCFTNSIDLIDQDRFQVIANYAKCVFPLLQYISQRDEYALLKTLSTYLVYNCRSYQIQVDKVN